MFVINMNDVFVGSSMYEERMRVNVSMRVCVRACVCACVRVCVCVCVCVCMNDW